MAPEADHLEECIAALHQTRHLRSKSDVKLGSFQRKSLGAFLTPFHVAEAIIETALSTNLQIAKRRIKTASDDDAAAQYLIFINQKIIDPACGTGIILSATIKKLFITHAELRAELLARRPNHNRRPPLSDDQYLRHLITQCVFGIDLDAQSADLTKRVLSARYCEKEFPRIKCGDALELQDELFNRGIPTALSDSVPPGFEGFDIVVMNPPYDRLKVDKDDLAGITDTAKEYSNRKSAVANTLRRIKSSGDFPLSDYGVIDLYKLFIELAIRISSATGSVGFIVPYSLLGDKSCQQLRLHILEHCSVQKVLCIPEKVRLFDGVSQAFTIVGFNKGGRTGAFQLELHRERTLVAPQFKVSVKPAAILALSDGAAIPAIENIGWKIIEKLKGHRRLSQIPHIFNLRGECDLTMFSDLISVKDTGMRLVRGESIEAFHVRGPSGKPSYVDYRKLSERLPSNGKLRFVAKKRLVTQQISNMGQTHRLKFARAADIVLANSCNFIALDSEHDTDDEQLWLLGVLNSSLLDWRFRITSTNNHINNYELADLPLASIPKKFGKSALKKMVLAQEASYSEPLQSQIDASIFKTYGVTFAEASYIMSMQRRSDSYISDVKAHF